MPDLFTPEYWNEEALTVVKNAFPDLDVLSVGASYSGGDKEGLPELRSVTCERPGGPVNITVFEVCWENESSGWIMEIATTHGDASFDQVTFRS